MCSWYTASRNLDPRTPPQYGMPVSSSSPSVLPLSRFPDNTPRASLIPWVLIRPKKPVFWSSCGCWLSSDRKQCWLNTVRPSLSASSARRRTQPRSHRTRQCSCARNTRDGNNNYPVSIRLPRFARYPGATTSPAIEAEEQHNHREGHQCSQEAEYGYKAQAIQESKWYVGAFGTSLIVGVTRGMLGR
jgi:hypothetical protein